MDNLPRFIFYLSGLLTLSSAFTLFTTSLLPFVNNGTTLGTIAFFGFGLAYMNIVSISSRRFMRRLQGPTNAPYIFAIFVAAPPAFWVTIFEDGNATSPIVYIPMIIVACATGAYFGHKMGLKAQIKFQENIKAYLEQDRRLHDNSSTESDISSTSNQES